MNEPSDPVQTSPQTKPPEIGSAGAPSSTDAMDCPTILIGRYQVIRNLGQGGFGRVYLARDEKLERLVALKLPYRQRIASSETALAYVTEARVLATMDHPNIVPVYDVCETEDGSCFVVSKFIEGCDLGRKIRDDPPSIAEGSAMIAQVAEALHYAHRKGLVHRDIKPANILIDSNGKPYVADFGLALREENFGKGPHFAGTPAYMSPEQANGEGHRVDGRSDVFSLGVVFYELLSGRRPFRGETEKVILDQIAHVEARPPRQIDDKIPKELERICLKALSKRASERYTTAKDIAEDLQHFLAEASAEMKLTRTGGGSSESDIATPDLSPTTPRDSDAQPVMIVPKGLRSYDGHDADFFLELLPGARDREGMPDSLRFWKTRIEETDAERTFSVGLMYGPSGCGKSSLVKAGLLPRLSDAVIAVYVEASDAQTETRLLNGLRKYCPALSGNLSLKQTLASLRLGQGIPVGKKVLIILDQFEQWLHTKKEEEKSDLTQALRQCEGERLQCIVMVRDDFWMAVSRFMQALEVQILEGENSRLVDLFDLLHARKVLASFGRAYGRLPADLGKCSKEQDAFLDQAVAGLAQEGKIICVRLSLFAEMIKGKTWTPATLKEMGGTEGVGVTFLEETFIASSASQQHRLHQKAAQGVLKALLPESGIDIKGHMRSQLELLEASGYGSRPQDFHELLSILDGKLRLITPTDPEGKDDAAPSTVKAGEKYYQLTHDYLIHSLRGWLARKQKESRRGRAELLLADRAALWNSRPENRQLPSLGKWINIRWLTKRNDWTPPQRRMMAKAGKYHAARGLVFVLLLTVATVTSLAIGKRAEERRKETYADGLVQAVLSADTAETPAIIGKMAEYRNWIDPLLHETNEKAEAKSRQKLNASLALLPVDATEVTYLRDRLLDAEPQNVLVIREALAPHKSELLDKLWEVVEGPPKGKEGQRLRGAAALAMYDPENQRWAKVQEPVASDMVKVPAVYLKAWMDLLRPVRARLLPPLSVVYGNSNRPVEQSFASDILSDYAVDQPNVLANLVMDANAQQFAIFFPKLKDLAEKGLPALIGEIDWNLPSYLPFLEDRREKLAKRQANAAVALFRMKQFAKVWPLFKHSPDPRVRSYLIHRLYPLGADAKVVVDHLGQEPDITIRRAVLLTLGEYKEDGFSPDERKSVLPKLKDLYRSEADPGLHAASEWLLRKWKQEAWLEQINEEWAKDKEKREKQLAGIKQIIAKNKEKPSPQWYVNGQGQTMVVISSPEEFTMGSPSTDSSRQPDEVQHKKRIGRTFAIAAKAL